MLKGFSITQVLGASGVTLSPSNVWDDAGTTFTGIRFNVTDTASASGSSLLDLQVSGSSKFRVQKDGRVFLDAGSQSAPTLVFPTSGGGIYNGAGVAIVCGNNRVGWFTPSGLQVLASPGTDVHLGLMGDVFLFRDAAGILAQRNGASAQTKRIYGTFTDASNYRRVAIAMTTGGVASIAPEGAGTGASGNVLHISGLPTANPGAGILWNDAGTVKVGT